MLQSEKLTRIAIVNSDKCKPKKCGQECKRSCPVVRMGKLCIEVAPTDKIAFISEELCIGCGICVKKWYRQFYVNATLFAAIVTCNNTILMCVP